MEPSLTRKDLQAERERYLAGIQALDTEIRKVEARLVGLRSSRQGTCGVVEYIDQKLAEFDAREKEPAEKAKAEAEAKRPKNQALADASPAG